VVGELLAGLVRHFAEGLAVEFVERRSNDADLGSKVRTRQVQQAGQKLSARQIACGAEHYDDMRRRAVFVLLGSLGCRGIRHTTIVTKAGRAAFTPCAGAGEHWSLAAGPNRPNRGFRREDD
jgi:hypothetical protein